AGRRRNQSRHAHRAGIPRLAASQSLPRGRPRAIVPAGSQLEGNGQADFSSPAEGAALSLGPSPVTAGPLLALSIIRFTAEFACTTSRAISGWRFANTRNISSANACPINSTPLKSKITILNSSTLAITLLAWDLETSWSLPYFAKRTGTTVLLKPWSSSSPVNWSYIFLIVLAVWLCSFSQTSVPRCSNLSLSSIQSFSSPNSWEKKTPPERMSY